nr:MAG TPA: hypothetical protein [Caudoviricetes sp.]
MYVFIEKAEMAFYAFIYLVMLFSVLRHKMYSSVLSDCGTN